MRVTLVAFSLAILLFSCAEEADTELEITKKLANDGDATAQFNLGIIYADGEGVPQDLKEAEKWWRMSAEQGHSDAQKNLGVMYNFGEGVPQDYKEAVKWWRMSADQGNAAAQWGLGMMFTNGDGVPQDYKEAFAWFSVAQANGDEEAKEPLSNLTNEMTKEQIADAMSLATEIQNRIEANKKD